MEMGYINDWKLYRLYRCGLHSFWTFFCFVGNGLTFVQTFITTALDRGIMDKNILTPVLWRNETETLGIIKPFDCAVKHISTLLALLFGNVAGNAFQ
jgi:hypothetical protein